MRDFQLPGRSVVMSTGAMIAASQPMATQVGLDVLRRGGSAIDAAVAAVAVLCVTEPGSTGIGGDCFVLYHEASSGKLYGLNGSGRAPAAATLEAMQAKGLAAVPEQGIDSITVPGAVHAWEAVHQRFGRLDWEMLLQPAINYGDGGYAVTPVVHGAWQRAEKVLARDPYARRMLLRDDKAPPAGSVHRQPELAQTLRVIAKHGSAGFYTGAVAAELVRACQAQGGFLAEADLAAHESQWVDPISTSYRGVELFEIPPSGQGIVTLMLLNTLAHADFGKIERQSAAHVHLFAEAFKLAMTERDRFVCDPDVTPVPVDDLLSLAFAKQQYARIQPEQALPQNLTSTMVPHRDTVYLSVVDRDGNAASFINSLFWSFGSGIVGGETGVMLQNRGAGFVMEADHPNCIAPGKRPLHTIIPAMAYRDGKPWLCFGVMGGQFQAMGQAYVLSNMLDYGLDIQEAIDAPRFQALMGTLSLERGFDPSIYGPLSRRGHAVEEAPLALGGAQAVMIDHAAGVLHGASDPRKDGMALGF